MNQAEVVKFKEQLERNREAKVYFLRSAGGIRTFQYFSMYEELVRLYQQIVCLLAGQVLLILEPKFGSQLHSKSAPVGSWTHRVSEPLRAFEVFQLAKSAKDTLAFEMGYAAWHNDWPIGTSQHVSNVKKVMEGLSDLGTLVYWRDSRPGAIVGGAWTTSLRKRVEEALETSSAMFGVTVSDETSLRKFLEMLECSQMICVIDEIQST